jgi:uroporphyrinogen-III decarboxylase
VTSKERILTVLDGGKADLIPAFPHWWGVYKLDILGMDPRLFPTLGGPRLAEIDANFYETFKPDLFHLGGGASREIWDMPIERVGDEMYLFDPASGRRRRLMPDWTIETMPGDRLTLGLTSKSEIDDYVARYYPDHQAILESGTYDHVREIVRRYGDRVFVAVNIGSPVCSIFGPNGPLGYEQALVALHEKPALMRYLIERSYEGYLEEAKALAAVGCHGLIVSEAYVAADTVSPGMFDDFVYEVFKHFHQRVAALGVVPFMYFMGNINPLLPRLADIGIKCLMVEEPKKGFDVDVVKIKQQLADRVCLVGNVDSVEVMWRGTPADVERAVQAQLPAARQGGFIMSTGSPLTVGTPVENVHTFMRAAHVPY